MSFAYRISGLAVECDWPLRIPREDASCGVPDIRIKRAACPPLLDSVLPFEQSIWQIDVDGNVAFPIGDGCSVAVYGGELIELWQPQGSPRSAELFLLGTSMGVIYQQRGLLPLHAASLSLDGAGFAICGVSGEGKSTLTAELITNNCTVLSDDVTAVHWTEDARPLAFSEKPLLKLHRDALQRLDRNPDALDEIPRSGGKRYLPVDSDEICAQISGIYMLESVDEDDPAADTRIGIEPLANLEALALLGVHTYGGYLSAYIRGLQWHMDARARVLRAVPCFRVRRPRGLAHLAHTAQLLMLHVRERAIAGDSTT